MELIVQFCKGLKRQTFKCALCRFLSKTPNIPIIHGPKPGFEIPFKSSQKPFSPQKG